MYKKRPNEHGIISKFSTILPFGLICLCKKIKAGEGSVRVSFRTRRWYAFPLGTRNLFEGSSVCKKPTPKIVPIRPKKLPQHVRAMSWHHAEFHDFQPCFGITGIKKPSFSIFPAEPRSPDVWISLPSLAWDLEIHPRTHMWFLKQLWCTGARACSSNSNYAH